jgi:hypothetical protein
MKYLDIDGYFMFSSRTGDILCRLDERRPNSNQE